jgi:hypothetical protein
MSESDCHITFDKRILTGVAIAAIFMGVIGCVVAAVVFTSKPAATATAILSLNRPAQMSIEEFDNYRNNQRRMIVSEYVLAEAAEDPLVARTRFVSRQANPAEALAAGLKDLSDDNQSELIVLSFECPDGAEAVTILDEIIDEYLSTIVVEAFVQRDGLLSGVKKTHERINQNFENLKQVRAVLAEVNPAESGQDPRPAIRLEDRRTELINQKANLDDVSRAKRIDQAILYIDKQLAAATNSEEILLVDDEVEKLDHDLQRFETRLGQIAADIAEWDSHTTPEITVIQHAQLARDPN